MDEYDGNRPLWFKCGYTALIVIAFLFCRCLVSALF